MTSTTTISSVLNTLSESQWLQILSAGAPGGNFDTRQNTIRISTSVYTAEQTGTSLDIGGVNNDNDVREALAEYLSGNGIRRIGLIASFAREMNRFEEDTQGFLADNGNRNFSGRGHILATVRIECNYVRTARWDVTFWYDKEAEIVVPPPPSTSFAEDTYRDSAEYNAANTLVQFTIPAIEPPEGYSIGLEQVEESEDNGATFVPIQVLNANIRNFNRGETANPFVYRITVRLDRDIDGMRFFSSTTARRIMMNVIPEVRDATREEYNIRNVSISSVRYDYAGVVDQIAYWRNSNPPYYSDAAGAFPIEKETMTIDNVRWTQTGLDDAITAFIISTSQFIRGSQIKKAKKNQKPQRWA